MLFEAALTSKQDSIALVKFFAFLNGCWSVDFRFDLMLNSRRLCRTLARQRFLVAEGQCSLNRLSQDWKFHF